MRPDSGLRRTGHLFAAERCSSSMGETAADAFRRRPAPSSLAYGVRSVPAHTITPVARGVIGNTPGFDPGIPSSSLGGPVLFFT